MVRIIVDISGVRYENLMSLVKKGKYRDLNQLLDVAAQNQIRLELDYPGSARRTAIHFDTTSDNITRYVTSNDLDVAESVSADFTNFTRLPDGEPVVVRSPDDATLFLNRGETSDTPFLWGQYNRIFPAKLGLRVLHNLIANGRWSVEANKTVDMDKYRYKAAEVARGLGMHIRENDDRWGRGRSTSFSTGLPIGREDSKSLSRYMNHFLVRRRKADGVLEGLLARLKMVNVVVMEDGTLGIGMTEQGLKFSSIDNRRLLGEDAAWPLADEEIQMYLAHVLEYVPEESAALSELLHYIKKGIVTVKELDKKLASVKRDRIWTDAMIITNRAGTLSRLWELKLVTRSDEKRPEYTITALGASFLDNSKKGDTSMRAGE
jgi:hypothetical protein